MDLKETRRDEVQNPEKGEGLLEKAKGLLEGLKKDPDKKAMSIEECDEALSGRLDDGKAETEKGVQAEDALNKQGVDFGLAGCEGFCRKVHDGTRVHGTYY